MTVSVVNNGDSTQLPEPSWYQTEKAAQIGAIALGVIGTIGAAVAVSAIVMGAVALPCAIGLVMSVALLFGAVILAIQEHWEDPAYVEKMAKQAKEMPFHQLIETFPQKYSELLSKKEFTEKVVNALEEGSLQYPQALQYINHLQPEALTPYFKKASGNFIYPEWALNNGIIAKDDTWLQENMAKWCESASYPDLKKAYDNGCLTKEQVQNALLKHLKSEGFVNFFNKHVRHDYCLFSDGFITPEEVRPFATADAAEMSIKTILLQYGWDIFSKGVLDVSKFTYRFEWETSKLDLSGILQYYGPGVLLSGITSIQYLEGKCYPDKLGEFLAKRYGTHQYEMFLDPLLKDVRQFDNYTAGQLGKAYYDYSITKKKGREILKAQLDEMGFQSFFEKHKYNFDFFLINKDVKPYAEQAAAQMSIKNILKTFGWDIFKLGYLDPKDFQQKFEKEVKNMSFQQVLKDYGMEVVEMKMTTRAFLESRKGF